LRLHARPVALAFAVQVLCAALTKRSSSSEHPDGVLIEEAAKKWLPELYEEWRRALERWEAVGRPDHDPGTISLDSWETSRPAVRNPIKAAVEETGRALREACRRKLTTREWSATAMRGSPASARERIDGDFFLDSWIAMDGSGCASAGRRKSKVEIYGLRVRRAADVRKEDQAIAPTARSAAEVGSPYPTSPKPTYSEPTKFSPKKAPDQFTKWAKEQRRLGKIITQGNAVAATAEIFGRWPKGPTQKTVIAWCRDLHPTWTADIGTPPSRRSS
jgi:hypothetical protein